MTRLVALLVAGPLLGQTIDLQTLLDKVERRYNNARTVRVSFEQTYLVQGRARRSESGMLYLRKPGRMRWNYAEPAGKVFLSDGKDIYFYSPSTHRVEKSPMKATDDVRVPLAFLLGKLDFSRDFREFRVRREGADTFIAAIPKSDKAPYRQVDFVVTPNFQIRRLTVTDQDSSQMSFLFGDEEVNPELDPKLFTFQTPAGADLVETEDRN